MIGMHLNMVSVHSPQHDLRWFLASNLPSGFMLSADDEKMVLPFSEKFGDLMLEMGYLHIQGTKPDTVGITIGLNVGSQEHMRVREYF